MPSQFSFSNLSKYLKNVLFYTSSIVLKNLLISLPRTLDSSGCNAELSQAMCKFIITCAEFSAPTTHTSIPGKFKL